MWRVEATHSKVTSIIIHLVVSWSCNFLKCKFLQCLNQSFFVGSCDTMFCIQYYEVPQILTRTEHEFCVAGFCWLFIWIASLNEPYLLQMVVDYQNICYIFCDYISCCSGWTVECSYGLLWYSCCSWKTFDIARAYVGACSLLSNAVS